MDATRLADATASLQARVSMLPSKGVGEGDVQSVWCWQGTGIVKCMRLMPEPPPQGVISQDHASDSSLLPNQHHDNLAPFLIQDQFVRNKGEHF